MQFGSFQAVEPTNLTIEAGEFFSILGPSGCGKTTLLRLISGFLEPTSGRIFIGGSDMTGRPPNARPSALIFQNLALFPLMSVIENVAFGLEAQGMARTERLRRAEALLELVALTGQGSKKPSELSGGQRQRVAIARALAVEPAVLLLDEPLSALDLKLRQHMRGELKAIQRKTGVTFIYITHDQGEALAMSDRIALMNAGVIEQVGTPDAIYLDPATPFAATFVGEQNIFRGKILASADGLATLESPHGPLLARNPRGLPPGSEAMLLVRPEAIGLGKERSNQISGQLLSRDLEGAFFSLKLRAKDQDIRLNMHTTREAPNLEGDIPISFAAEDALLLPLGEVARD